MKRFTMFACLALTLVFAMNAFASDVPERAKGHDSVFHGGSTQFSKVEVDTLFLIGPWGSGAQVNGEFEDINGNPSMNGWTTYDITAPTVNHWHVSDYHSENVGGPGNMAMYCGDETIVSCDGGVTDPVGGYGNGWNDILQFTYTVADPGAGCLLEVSGIISWDSEPDYDKTNFIFQTSSGPENKGYVDGKQEVGEAFSYNHSYGTADYVGDNQDQVVFQIHFKSDGGWSDEDCSWGTAGAAIVDNLHATASNGSFDQTVDFETADMGNWTLPFALGSGDFSQLWTGLEDIDACFTNYSPQIAFINDGSQIPGVAASECQSWCYGPDGYTINTTGGAAAADGGTLYIALESPVVEWPAASYDGSRLTFGVYRHEELSSDSPGIFYTWGVKTATSEAGLTAANWADRNFVYYGGPDYVRAGDIVTDLLEPGVTHAQVQLTVYELGWIWGYDGDNGTPAPYYDNVRLTAFSSEGPGMSTRELDIAQDNFPEIGTIDLGNLANNNVRFDMANNNGADVINVPGDSIVCDVTSVRFGGALVSNRLVYTVDANPVFDPARTFPMTGSVDAQQAYTAQGVAVPDKWAYDLPDSGFLFPGDVMHYYFEATDEVAGSDPETSTLPSDISGYGDFSHPQAYNTSYEVHALPSVEADNSNPGILLWNDNANRGGENEWFGALNNIGLTMGVDYDVYYTNAPSSGVGNGLGSRCSDDLMARYGTLLYTSGSLGAYTIANGDDVDGDPSEDIQLLTNFMTTGSRNVFMTGDDLASDLRQSGGLTVTYLNSYMNVVRTSGNLRPLVDNQSAPLVYPVAGNPVFLTTDSWIAYGGCNGINTFDAVLAGAGSTRLARFADDNGVAAYDYSAATLNINGDDRVITMPYDFSYIYTDINTAGGSGGLAARVNVLAEVLDYFGLTDVSWQTSDVPGADKFFATNYPNPFNPSTKIQFNMPKAGHLSLKVYNVRGELVRTLINESRASGADHIMWDGTNDQGSNVSSGVYFYEARTAGNVVVNKMALVK